MIFFLQASYVGENLGEDNIMEVWFEDLKEDVPVELDIFIRNHVVESSKIKCHLNDWEVKVRKVNTRSIRRLYRVKCMIEVIGYECIEGQVSKNWKLNQRCQETSKQRYQSYHSHLFYFLVLYTLKLRCDQVEFHPDPHK